MSGKGGLHHTYILEAIYDGRHIAHRELIQEDVRAFSAIEAIRFADGSLLCISVRKYVKGPRLKLIIGPLRSLLFAAAAQKLTGIVDESAIRIEHERRW